MKFIRSLRKFQKNIHGVSVIVGALMLTLIVVTAAVSFAVFTAQKQEELQKAEYSKLLRESELLRVGDIEELSFDSSFNSIQNITISLSSAHIRTSTISALKISSASNQGYVTNFSIDRMNGIIEKWHMKEGKYRIYNTTNHQDIDNVNMSLQLVSNEIIKITVKNITENCTGNGFTIKRNDPIILNVYTTLTNDFSKTFMPPTPNIEIRQEDNSIILDGSRSFCEDEAAIVTWKWTLNNTITKESLPDMYGKIINPNRILADDSSVENTSTSEVKWNISLFIQNNYGMIGIKNITYSHDFKDIMTYTESLSIDSIIPGYNIFDNKLMNLTITIRNQYKYNSNIEQIKINQEQNSSINSSKPWSINNYTYHDRFFNLDSPLDMDKPIHIRIKTDLGNTFEKTFYPPTANMIIDLKGDTDIPYLDGSNSDNTGDAYIVLWEWNITSYPYLFQDLNNDSYFNNSEEFLRYFDYSGSHFLSKTRVQGEHLRGGKIAFEDNNTANESFIFWDKNYNNAFDNDEEILNYDPDGNGINAIVSGNETGYIWTYNSTGKPFLFYDNRSDWVYNEAEGDFRIDYTNFNGEYGKNDTNDTDGGVLLFIKWNKEFYGRIVSYLLNEGCLHEITLTVTNNYGLKGTHTMYYKY